jgi:hypothetical protein
MEIGLSCVSPETIIHEIGRGNQKTTVEAIEQEIKKLSPQELAELRQWLAAFDADNWDAQIESDAEAGKLDALAVEALAEYETGKAREI